MSPESNIILFQKCPHGNTQNNTQPNYLHAPWPRPADTLNGPSHHCPWLYRNGIRLKKDTMGIYISWFSLFTSERPPISYFARVDTDTLSLEALSFRTMKWALSHWQCYFYTMYLLIFTHLSSHAPTHLNYSVTIFWQIPSSPRKWCSVPIKHTHTHTHTAQAPLTQCEPGLSHFTRGIILH